VKRVCVFCGSNFGARAAYREAAKELGTWIAERRLGLVYGGARVGLMGVVAQL
jgi:predicted Rossmann-fold nucleotide-binding protein